MPDAWIYYRSPKPHSPDLFAKQDGVKCHLDASIAFLGVWDTVGSLGIPGSLFSTSNKAKFAFHDTNPSPLVKRGVQALAIDEHRHDLAPTFWTGDVPQASPSNRCGSLARMPTSAVVTGRGRSPTFHWCGWSTKLRR